MKERQDYAESISDNREISHDTAGRPGAGRRVRRGRFGLPAVYTAGIPEKGEL